MRVKRVIYCFAAAFAVAACLSSCVVNEKITPVEEDMTIWYNLAPVKELPQTKAVNEFDKAKTFGSYAYRMPEGKTYDANKEDGDVELFINNEKICYQTDRWVAENRTYYWPYYGSLTFISYAPYELSSRTGYSCTAASGITLTDFTLSNSVGYYSEADDILIADIAKDLTKESHPTSGVPTVFKHKLCKVAVKASLNNTLQDGEYVTITGITLENIYTKGDYGQFTGWSDHQELNSYTKSSLDMNLEVEPVSIFDETLMIPQTTTLSDRGTGNDPKIVLNYSIKLDGKDIENKTAELKLYSGPASPAAWEEGKIITYYVSISTKDEYIEFSGKPDAWGDGGNSDVNMGL